MQRVVSALSLMPELRLLIACCLSIASLGCEPVRRAEAQYCVAVAAFGRTEDADLARMFDKFASEAGLAIDASSPAAREYASREDQDLIVVSFGMGDHGAIVSFFHFRESGGEVLMERLKQVVEQKVAPKYRTIACQDIKGFRNPVVFD